MSTVKTRHVFTSESVSEGHPDKVCDQISDAILDALLAQDPESRVACETLATTNFIVLSGEITTKANVNFEKIARNVAANIGYDNDNLGFNAHNAEVLVKIHQQSPDIAQGVNAETSLAHEQGAGDQGMMFGFACGETDAFMPAPIYFCHRIMEEFARLRHSGNYPFLRPDAKTQISFLYDGGKPVAIKSIVVSHQHTPDMEIKDLEELAHQVVNKVIPRQYLDASPDLKFYINQTGRFVLGGPAGDTGLTGRKIIVDSYGGMGRHGGGAFSGKDPSKVDRSATYMARYVAKNIVAAGLASVCEIQVSYVIGQANPLSLNVNTFGTGIIPDAKIADFLLSGQLFDFRPAKIIEMLDLKTPKGWSYLQSASYGHFGRDIFPWEKLDKVAALKEALLGK
ncbi:MAG: methionine adenosyltransferase [Lentisphaeria bacterium]|nr:methionine adenosyltransferase [Lentisphaeria bacterium]